jgi:hypothetical protein
MWPHERSLGTNLEKKPFALIGVNKSGSGGFGVVDARKVKEVMDKEKLNWRSFMDQQGTIFGKWHVAVTPTLYVIDHKA